MGARGPLPLPSRTKAMRGTLRPCRTVANEAQVGGAPRCPAWLPADAKKEFRRLCKLLLAAGLIGEIDGNALTRYVTTWLSWRRAVQMIEKTGDVLAGKDSEGKPKIKRSPYVDIAATLAAQLDKLEQAFGFHPSARSRINVAPAPSQSDPTERFFVAPLRIAE